MLGDPTGPILPWGAPDDVPRLSPVDASFLAQEHEASHMHVGAIAIFEGPPPSYDEFIAYLRAHGYPAP